MGLCIALQTESGEQIELVADDKNLLDKLLGFPDANAFPMLASIDRYGDTIFNRMQMERFLQNGRLFLETPALRRKKLIEGRASLGGEIRA
jgi:hypothetical protein